MRVIVTGGRKFNDERFMDRAMKHLFRILGGKFELAHGGALGADTLAGEWAKSMGFKVRIYPANWKEHGRSAGPRRNQIMLDDFRPDFVLAFPGGKGTADMVARAMKAKVPVLETSTWTELLTR